MGSCWLAGLPRYVNGFEATENDNEYYPKNVGDLYIASVL